ncbi:MAG: hypothetical protein ACQGVK_07675 [Myxococcota bacterium]
MDQGQINRGADGPTTTPASPAPSSDDPRCTATPVAPPRWSAPVLYLLLAVTYGLYAWVWTWRHARYLERVGHADESPPSPRAWAWASLSPPLAWLVLYEIGRRQASRAGRDAARASVWGPPLLYLGLVVALYLSGIGSVWTLVALALALPPVLVQAQIARVQDPAPRTATRRDRRWLEWIAAGGGVLMATLTVSVHDIDALTLLRVRELEPGVRVESHGAGFSVAVPTAGWRRLPPGTLGGERSVLELAHASGRAQLIAYQADDARLTIDDVTSTRRTIISEAETLLGVEERRTFRAESSYDPLSYTDYQVQGALGTRAVYLVVTTPIEGKIVEIVATSTDLALDGPDLKSLVLSVRASAIPSEHE